MGLCFELLSRDSEQQIREASPPKVGGSELFANELAPEAHIFKLKKSSSIFAAKIIINDQIILSESQYRIKIQFSINELMRRRLSSAKNKIQLHFNQRNSNNQRSMICEVAV